MTYTKRHQRITINRKFTDKMKGLRTHFRLYKCPKDGKNRFDNFTWPNAKEG